MRLEFAKKKGRFEMTLKQPHPEGLLETNQILSEEQAHALIHGGQIMEGMLKHKF